MSWASRTGSCNGTKSAVITTMTFSVRPSTIAALSNGVGLQPIWVA